MVELLHMKKIKYFIVYLFLASPIAVFAQTKTGEVVKLKNPLGSGATKITVVAGNIIKQGLTMVGSLALLMFVYGGVTWMTSSGNQEKVKKGRDTIVWSAIGLIIVFASYGLVRFLILNVKG